MGKQLVLRLGPIGLGWNIMLGKEQAKSVYIDEQKEQQAMTKPHF
jgi:hypothetical protein